MHIDKLALIRISTIFIGFFSNLANAQSPKLILGEDGKEGWSGTTGTYILAGEGKSFFNSINEEGDQIIDSLSDEPSDYDFATMYPTLRINYSISNTSHISLGVFDTGVTSNSLIETQSLVALSFYHTFSNDSIMWMSIAPNIPGLYQVWQDPYKTGSVLEKTDASLNVFSLGSDYIMGSPISISASLGEQKIENDHAGQSFHSRINQRPLNNKQISSLRRDTTFGTLRASLTHSLAEGLYIEGGVSYFQSDAAGNANKFSSISIDLGLVYTFEGLDFYISGDINSTKFDYIHPIFESKREDDNYNLSLGFSYKEPFNWDSTSFEVFVGTYNTVSNINFYDEESIIFATGFSYEF